MRRAPVIALVVFATGLPLSTKAEPRNWFREAIRLDLTGSPADVRRAFELYHRAAQAGLPEAQFNVAVMLDSGRGVAPDHAQAALWYARAASRGNKRAAYNLGQLYEAGQGVPRNPDLARAWYRLSALPAARARLALVRRDGAKGLTLTAPMPVAPTEDGVAADLTEVELVWTASAQPEPVRFYVELWDVSHGSPQEIYSGFTESSSVKVSLPGDNRRYAWRVLTVAGGVGRYAASDWVYLSAEAP
jgi:TPR repeat protein